MANAQDQHDQDHRMGGARDASGRSRPLWPLEDSDPRLRGGRLFIAALRHDRLDAPWVIDGAMNREFFDLYVETQLAPTLHKGDVVILDNLATHRSPKAAAILKDIGAWFLFLPPYSPDLNPIEMAFAKIKALIRKAAARTYDQLWQAVGNVCNLFRDEECYNFFKAAGYETD